MLLPAVVYLAILATLSVLAIFLQLVRKTLNITILTFAECENISFL
jgi:hypothetical protein